MEKESQIKHEWKMNLREATGILPEPFSDFATPVAVILPHLPIDTGRD